MRVSGWMMAATGSRQSRMSKAGGGGVYTKNKDSGLKLQDGKSI